MSEFTIGDRMAKVTYEDNIRSNWKEHIRMRPGMYIGKLGDGSAADDGIYVLLKEVLDNSIDEFVMGAGNSIEVSIEDRRVTIRDLRSLAYHLARLLIVSLKLIPVVNMIQRLLKSQLD